MGAGLHDLFLQVLFDILGGTMADGCTPNNSEIDIKLFIFLLTLEEATKRKSKP